MKLELEEGEYTRSDEGEIDKFLYKTKSENGVDKYVFEKRSMSNPEYHYAVKHSKNIIDLIEVGDYVNGKRVFATDNRINDNGEKVILTENYDEWTDDGVVSNKDIKSIVTKEQYKSVEYIL